MLVTAKIKLQADLMSMLQQAYMQNFASNKVVEEKAYDVKAKMAMQKKALKFAQTAAGPVANAIYKFVKEIGITATIPPSVTAPPAPPLPGGPCTGTMLMTNFKII